MNTALVLGGGGAKGSYQASVANEISDEYDFDAITGVSAGALNGSILAQKEPKKLISLWRGLEKKDVWSGGHGPIRYFKLAVGSALGLYDSAPLRSLIEKSFDPNKVQIPFKAGAVSLNTGSYVPFEISPDRTYTDREAEKARRFVVASSAIPGAVEPVEVSEEHKKMADGGIRNIAPIGDAIDFGADRIITILNSVPNKRVLTSEPKPSHVFGVGRAALQVLLNETMMSDVRAARNINQVVRNVGESAKGFKEVDLQIISPSEDLGSAQDFTKTEKRIEIGIKDGKRHIEN
jgi:NTE family protein